MDGSGTPAQEGADPAGSAATPLRVVIVGGGVAGLELAARLARRRGLRGRMRLTLIDRGLSHFWKPVLHTLAAGTDRADRKRIDFLAQARASGFEFWPGLLVGVDRAAREVQLAPDVGEVPGLDPTETSRVGYDLLVLALGSRTNDFGTPGVAEHGLTIDDSAGAGRFRLALRRELFGSAAAGRPLSVAIVGGGPTGVELAAELKRALDLIGRHGDRTLRPPLRLTLLDRGPRLLATFPEPVSRAAATLLRGLGVTVRPSTGVTAVDAGGLTLEGGERVEARIVVWAAGTRAPEVLGAIDGLERSRSGQLVVDASLRTADARILALGDCAHVGGTAGDRGLPGTAQVAHQQARHLARHLDPWHPERLPPFRYVDRGSLVELGGYAGWGTVGRYTFGGGGLQGLVAWMGHEMLFRQHQLVTLVMVRAAVALAADGLDRFVSPDVRLDA